MILKMSLPLKCSQCIWMQQSTFPTSYPETIAAMMIQQSVTSVFEILTFEKFIGISQDS